MYDGIEFPEPCYSMAILPIAKGGEEKIASGLTRLAEEDPTFTVTNNAETHQMVLSGMGTVAPNPYYTPEVAEKCMREIFIPTIKAMNAEGRTFKGCLYFGLMITQDGPKVIEYNCRFGDPETQVVLPLLESDLLTVMRAVTDGRLAETEVKFSDKSACCVVLASKGYPVKYQSGCEIVLPETGENREIYVAGAEKRDGRLLSHGGRVLGCVAVENTLEDAVRGAYDLADRVKFDNGFCRRDIGKRALDALKK